MPKAGNGASKQLCQELREVSDKARNAAERRLAGRPMRRLRLARVGHAERIG